MQQEKSPEDEAFDAITQSQMKKAAGEALGPSEVIKQVLRPFEEAVQEMSMDAMVYGTGMMKVSMNNQGQIDAEVVRYRDVFPKDYVFPVNRNDVLEEVAQEFDKMKSLGTTAESFAAFVRGMKK